jgi:TDG/mug DNA glycosylase family protein
MAPAYPFETLPDLLAPGLDLAFVGINPSLYSVRQGHYFARATNRFWPAFSQSQLSAPVRQALGLALLGPAHDQELLRFGIGFTDVVKRPSNNSGQLSPADFQEWAPRLRARLEHYGVRVACFHGLTAFRPFLRLGLGQAGIRDGDVQLGPQPYRLGPTRFFVVPNPSPANARYTVRDQAAWYDRVAAFLAAAGAAPERP